MRLILRCVIPVVCLNYKEGQISVKNTTIIWLKMIIFSHIVVVFLTEICPSLYAIF